MNKELFEAFVKWQQRQADIAMRDYEYAFYSFINSIGDDLVSIVSKSGELEGMSKAQVDRLIKALIDAQNGRYDSARRLLLLMLGYFADYVSHTEANLLRVSVANDLYSKIQVPPVSASGMTLPEHIQLLITYSAKKINDEVRIAWARKLSKQELINRITGTADANYKNGLIYDQKVKSRAMIDTAVQHSMSIARGETWGEHTGGQYRLLATLDHRTTDFCQKADGLLFTWGAPNALVPPFHYYCRTVTIPELPQGFEWLREGRTRASMNGYVDANTTYEMWVRDNPMPDDWKAPKRPKRRKKKQPDPKSIEDKR